MVQITIPYAYGRTVRVHAYGMKYACGTQQLHVANAWSMFHAITLTPSIHSKSYSHFWTSQ